jgi:ribosomal protein S18 acetylase RimI-like enzyme
VTEDVLHAQLEIRRVAPELERPLAEFFAALVGAGDDRRFHPHPFTAEAAAERARYRGNDAYAVATAGGRVLGYGMLRGWDEGYVVPSLGIAIHPDARGIGLGRALMGYLHAEAARRGARKIRLKVYPENVGAVALYRSLGYDLSAREGDELVGTRTLGRR